MSSNFTSITKKSKKVQRAHFAQARVLWPVSPVTRITPNKKHYDRKRAKKGDRYEN